MRASKKLDLQVFAAASSNLIRTPTCETGAGAPPCPLTGRHLAVGGHLALEEGKAVLYSGSQFATLKRSRTIKYRPRVFTEHGAVMLANVLRSPVAVRASIQVVRAFVHLRRLAGCKRLSGNRRFVIGQGPNKLSEPIRISQRLTMSKTHHCGFHRGQLPNRGAVHPRIG